jgi:tripartite-type tricarboxylate transporter receptor subunit TctC
MGAIMINPAAKFAIFFKIKFCILSLLSLGFSPIAFADAYPTKPITLVSPKAAGGAADLSARAFATIAEKYIGQPIRVVNKPGGAGVPGVVEVMNSAPDGYTLMAGLSAMMVSAPVFKKNNPYSTSDFTYISILEDQPITFAVRSDSNFKDINDLLLAIKGGPKNPIKVAVASKIGLATIAANALAVDLGAGKTSLKNVPFKNGPSQAKGLLAGDVDFASVNLASINSALMSGDARLLMVTSNKRNETYSSAPTAKESGLNLTAGISLWVGLIGPKGLSKDVLNKWEETLPRIFADPEYQAMLAKRGATLWGSLPKKTPAIVEGQISSLTTLKTNLAN